MSESYNIFVTGGAGYLGSILVPELLADGHKVTVLDNFMFKQNSLGHVCADPNFDVQRGDARDIDQLKPLVKDADIVIPWPPWSARLCAIVIQLARPRPIGTQLNP